MPITDEVLGAKADYQESHPSTLPDKDTRDAAIAGAACVVAVGNAAIKKDPISVAGAVVACANAANKVTGE